MSLRRPAALVLVAALALAPALIAVQSAAAAYPAPFVGSSSNGRAYVDAELGEMQVGVLYNDSLERAAGFSDWGISGDLPAGLTATSSGDVLLITGFPTTPGDVSFRIDSGADGADWDSLQFEVTVVDTPAAAVHGIIEAYVPEAGTPLVSMEPGGRAVILLSFENYSGSTSIEEPRIVLTLPDGTTSPGTGGENPWLCSGTHTFDCSRSGAMPPSGYEIMASLFVDLDADYRGSSFTITAQASGKNAPAVTTRITVPVLRPHPVLVPPADATPDNVALTAYTPGAHTDGSFVFTLTGNGSAFEYGPVPVGSDGSATYSGAVDASLNAAIDVVADYFDSGGSWVESSAVGSIYLYTQLSAAGSFYLNGQLYTDAVKLFAYSDYSVDGSSGAFLQYPGLTGGSYSITPGLDTRHSYYMWAQLTALGEAQTFYNSAGLATNDSDDRTTVGPRNFSNSMNFYWELPATFTDATMAVPRQNVGFTDGFTATSNVDVTYSVSSGSLPTGLSLDPDFGTVTGTATVVGEVYDFVITADNGYIDAVTGHITGTVLPEHIVPTWSDETLAAFRFGQAVTDGVSATGDPTISYAVSDGELPVDVTLNPVTGALGGTPSVVGQSYSFELNAHSAWGDVYASFSGTVLPAFAAPVWLDDELGELRVGETLTDGVSASGEPAPTYSAIRLPAWAALNATTGAVSASPTSQVTYDFTITAHNSLGDITQRFTGTVEPAWIAPSFTDSTVGQARGGVYLDDQVVADGDGPITYSVPLGAMPSWLALDTATGRVYGTPPLSAVGDAYSFTVTATGHGTATVTLSGVVASAPTVELTLNFAVGDIAAGSTFGFDIEGAGDSAPYSVTVNSTPIIVASGTTTVLGAASGTAAIPSIGAGAHSIVLLAYAADGTPRTTTVWFTVLRNGTIGAISLLGPLAYSEAALASSGVDPAVPAGVAALLLFLGFVAVRTRRRLIAQR